MAEALKEGNGGTQEVNKIRIGLEEYYRRTMEASKLINEGIEQINYMGLGNSWGDGINSS